MKGVLNNRIDVDIAERFKKQCKKDDVPFSIVMEHMISDWLCENITIKNKKNERSQFAVTIDSKLLEDFRAVCDRDGLSSGYILEQLMLHYCNQQNAPSPSENIPQTKTKLLSSNLDKAIQLLTDLRDDLERT